MGCWRASAWRLCCVARCKHQTAPALTSLPCIHTMDHTDMGGGYAMDEMMMHDSPGGDPNGNGPEVAAEPQEPTEEELIITELVGRGDGSQYEDPAFPASDTSLYNNPNAPPRHADSEPRATYGPHVWLRPEEIAPGAHAYFEGLPADSGVAEGPRGANDAWFLGALAAVASHPSQLIESLFGSEPDDYARFGVYTARFYRMGSGATSCATRGCPLARTSRPIRGTAASTATPRPAPRCGYRSYTRRTRSCMAGTSAPSPRAASPRG